jgi:hypothetical protein
VCLRWIALSDATRSLRNALFIQNLGYAGRVGQVTWDSLCSLYNLLTLSMDEQRQNCLVRGGLAAGGIWYALTRTSTLDPQVKARLVAEANPVHVFSRGTRAAAARGSWRKGILRETKTAEGWILWASLAAVAGRQRRAELKLRLQNLRLTPDGDASWRGPL